MKIRPAKLDDLAQLIAFEQGVIEAERPYDSSLKDEPITYYDLEALISADTSEVVVAEDQSKLIGCGYAQLRVSKSYVRDDIHSYLGFMYVAPDYRGKGVNKDILKALIEWSKSQGVNEVVLEVYSENSPAIRAYEKAGFASHMVKMKLDLTHSN